MNDITLLLTNFFGLFMESAPWLLMGLLVAGIMHELVPVSLLQKHMGKNSVGAVIKSAFIGGLASVLALLKAFAKKINAEKSK